MPSFNKVTQLGNVTCDVGLSYTTNQTAVSDFGLAVNRRWKGSDGQTRDETCFIDVRCFGKLAENVNKYVNKGGLILVDGHLTFETWKDKKDGGKRSRHRIIAETVQFMPSAGKREPGQEG